MLLIFWTYTKRCISIMIIQKKLKILVCGKTGCGKSTLLNTILGRYLFKIGGPGDGDDDCGFKPVTQNVTSVCTTMQNVLLEIFDSSGLQDGTGRDDEYLDDMHIRSVRMSI